MEENHLFKGAALRTAVECVYGMKDAFFSHGFTKEEIYELKEKAWNEATDKLIQESSS